MLYLSLSVATVWLVLATYIVNQWCYCECLLFINFYHNLMIEKPYTSCKTGIVWYICCYWRLDGVFINKVCLVYQDTSEWKCLVYHLFTCIGAYIGVCEVACLCTLYIDTQERAE